MDWLDLLIQPFCIPFLIWKQSVCFSISGSNCCFLFCIQISQEAGKVFWYSHLFKNIPQFIAIHTFKGFSVVSEAEVDDFSGILLLYLWCSGCWQLDPGSSAFSKSSLNIWKFSVHILLKPSLENFEHCFANKWNECNCHFNRLRLF